jgi:hypothetical protein
MCANLRIPREKRRIEPAASSYFDSDLLVFLLLCPRRLGSAYPLLNILPLLSLAVVVGSGMYALHQLQYVTDYDIIGDRNHRTNDDDDEAQRNRTERHDRVL